MSIMPNRSKNKGYFLSNLVYKFLSFINSFFKIFKKNFNIIHGLYDLIRNKAYLTHDINGKKINFFIPNRLTEHRVNTFEQFESEGIKWISKFDEDSIFWDIGSNIGLYSIYASCLKNKIDVVAFEPAPLNYSILSRNISINRLSEKIKIFQLALSNKANEFLTMTESEFIEGKAKHSVFGSKFIANENKYKIFSTNIDYLIQNKFLKKPNYLKIDIDGNEKEVLENGILIFDGSSLKSVSIEINELEKDNTEYFLNFFKKNNFKVENKYRVSKTTPELLNYIFSK